MGKNGRLTNLMKQLGALQGDARRTKGIELNRLKDEITDCLTARKTALEQAELESRLIAEQIGHYPRCQAVAYWAVASDYPSDG